MKKILFVVIAVFAIIGYASASSMSVQTKIFDTNSQPPIVGGVIDEYSDADVLKRGIIISSTLDNAVYKESENWCDISWYFDLKDYRIIDCTNIGNEQFWCSLKLLKSNYDYYIRAFVVMKDGTVSLGNVEKLQTKSFNRYNGTSDYANVWYAFSYTLFDLVTDEIINPNDGFYYSTNENPTRVRFQKGTSYNTCYKYATEWNYKLWYYHNTNHCDKNKVINLPIMTYSNGKLTINKNPLDDNKSITIYYSINGNYFRPETYTDVYQQPISITSPSTVYCYAISSDGYISYTNMYVIGDINDNNSESSSSDNNGTIPDIVDLGLTSGTLWAAWNIGASAPEEYGTYFAWGETAPKSNYDWSTYKFGVGSNFTKYNTSDGLTELELEDDAAYVILGKDWRMPTHNEELELANECIWESVTLNGISGYKITGPNGNSIFMPRGGLYDGTDYGSDGKKVSSVNTGGWYWSSTLNTKGSSYAQGLCFYPSLITNVGDHERCDGHNIRPVYVGRNNYSDYIRVSSSKTSSGEEFSIDINLENSITNYTAYQFDIVLPVGISIATNVNDKYLVTKADRYEDETQSLNVSPLGDNAYRIVCFSLSNDKIKGTSGAILKAVLSVADNVQSGTYEGAITNIIFTKSDGTQVRLKDSKITIVVDNPIVGDTNGDKEVNVSDIVEMINYIMDNPSAIFQKSNADLNGDGEVNVTDIVMMVNFIMSAQSSSTRTMSNRAGNMIDGDCLTVDDIIIYAGETKQASISLNNPGRKYTAFQFDLTLPEGITIVRNNNGKLMASLDTERKDDHILNVSELGNNTYRLLAFSMSNAELYGTNGPLVNITLQADADMSNGTNEAALKSQVFTATDGTQYKWSDLPFSIQVNGSENTGINEILLNGQKDGIVKVYALTGLMIFSVPQNDFTEKWQALPSGVYIVSGQKRIKTNDSK